MSSAVSTAQFKRIVKKFYKTNRRDLPWRNTRDPYKIFVSEIMLQQTQAPRVISKYVSFLRRFPNVAALANATLREVLMEWQGLGYNRRALALRNAAAAIVAKYNSKLPDTLEALDDLPGVGPYTAAAVATFAFNQSHVLIETNVRSVYLHHFFPRQTSVRDSQLLPYIERTLDRNDPREWYYALMDYGAYLKKTLKNPSRRSAHHAKQSLFEGSRRQLRGNILKALTQKAQSQSQLLRTIKARPEVLTSVLSDLQKNELVGVRKRSGRLIYCLA
jgi:A/G-specific adenine glycosylase